MVFDETQKIYIKSDCLRISSFLGRTIFMKLLKKLRTNIKRIDQKSKRFPADPFELFHKQMIESRKGAPKNHDENEFRKKLESELSHNVNDFLEGAGAAIKKMNAIAIDCYLYARTDKYLKPVES